ncbi:universal stress protein [Thermodesulfobacteriota bacterium]
MYKKILVPMDIDYPKTAVAVYQHVAEFATPSGADIRLIGVMPGFGMPIVASYISNETKSEIVNRLKESLEIFIQENCDDSVSFEVRTGKNWEEIIKAADKWGADLIAVYYDRHRDRDMNEVHSKGCARRVSENANCSVLWLRKVMS